MLAALFKNWKTRTAEFEAPLSPAPGGAGRGDVKMSVYSDGSTKFEIEIEEIEAPEGAEISVTINGVEICAAEARNGRCYEHVDSGAHWPIPAAAEGDVAEISYAGDVLLSGVFCAD